MVGFFQMQDAMPITTGNTNQKDFSDQVCVLLESRLSDKSCFPVYLPSSVLHIPPCLTFRSALKRSWFEPQGFNPHSGLRLYSRSEGFVTKLFLSPSFEFKAVQIRHHVTDASSWAWDIVKELPRSVFVDFVPPRAYPSWISRSHFSHCYGSFTTSTRLSVSPRGPTSVSDTVHSMATHKPSPLRDRLLSNSPDPIKSSILRESGMGWATGSMPSSSSSSSVTSPLRIAKRDSPVLERGVHVARRSSSSFKHVRNNNLVSKSPFKNQQPALPTPSRPTPVVFPTRRVSGEKRPRPPSMHEDAETENERPFSLKRDRKQSKTFQGLLEKEPVTKSPFKRLERTVSMDETSPPPSTMPSVTHLPNPTPINTRFIRVGSEPPALASGPSPGRSSLVSKRLHGPRLSGGKRERRKTVTFDERCDVVEFDRDTSDEDSWGGSDEEERYGEPDQDTEEDPFFCGEQLVDDPPLSELQTQPAPDVSMEDDSYENAHLNDSYRASATRTLLDPNTSITGLVDEMFFSSNADLTSTDTLGSSTPPHASDIPTDLENEDGVPFGHTHHTERLAQCHQQESPQRTQPPPCFSPHASPHSSHPSAHQSPQVESSNFIYPFGSGSSGLATPNELPTTPSHPSPMLAQSTPPFDRLTYLRAEDTNEEIDVDAGKPPMSPSPLRPGSSLSTRNDGVIPKYMWPRGVDR